MRVEENVTCAKKGKKETERDRLLAEFCSDPRIRFPPLALRPREK